VNYEQLVYLDIPYIQRDVSWLSFNYRVLQEVKDPSVPLMERIKFLAIYSANLGEFFRVRVANHRNLVRLGRKTKAQLDFDPKAVLKAILDIVNTQLLELSDIFENHLIPELKKNKIYILDHRQLNEEQKESIEKYFRDHMLPFVQPVLLVKNKIKPFLNDAELYLVIELEDRSNQEETQYAITKIPSDHLPRFIEVPSSPDRHEVIFLDDIVRHSAELIFPGYKINASYSIKLTRDAELYIDDEYSGDLLQKIKRSLVKRNVGSASRLVYDREMPKRLLDFLKEAFELIDFDLIPEGRYHNNFDFFKFPSFGMSHLHDVDLPPLPYPTIEKANSIFDVIAQEDHLIHVPYHRYESTIKFFEDAANDPFVTHVKIVQYRVAKRSRVMDALTKAANTGKQVFAFIEVKARFDEEANLNWGEKLERDRVNVRYSFPGLKVHSKIALVRRMENGVARLYAYLSTGNFNEDTAKTYADSALFTADERITSEVARLFSFLETAKIPVQSFNHLLVGQFNLTSTLKKFILREIDHAQKGLPARITLKLNSIQDPEMVKLLYKASESGVEIKLIIRGICSLIPGQKGYSTKIEARSIVDRYLEHARVYYFYNDGEEDLYLSSADWMVRNLYYRIETAFPIYSENLKAEIIKMLEIQWRDNMKARIIDKDSTNNYVQDTSDLSFRSQMETYYYFKRKLERMKKAQERSAMGS
jgi:polyphosphate kinase